jgi:hypothetical protein
VAAGISFGQFEHTARASRQRTDGWRSIRHQRRIPGRRLGRRTVLIRTADVEETVAALVRLLARQAAREHLERLANPDAEEITDEG